MNDNYIRVTVTNAPKQWDPDTERYIRRTVQSEERFFATSDEASRRRALNWARQYVKTRAETRIAVYRRPEVYDRDEDWSGIGVVLA